MCVLNVSGMVGVATDYCVYYTALDAASLGYITTLVEDGVRGVTPAGVTISKANVRPSSSLLSSSIMHMHIHTHMHFHAFNVIVLVDCRCYHMVLV
jgi:hypothetical protein